MKNKTNTSQNQHITKQGEPRQQSGGKMSNQLRQNENLSQTKKTGNAKAYQESRKMQRI